MKKLFPVLAVLVFMLIVCINANAAEIRKVPIKEAAAIERLPMDNPTPRNDGHPGIPYVRGDATDSPGMIVGTTYYDYQTNGSTGTRIAVHDCGIHMAWMNGIGQWTGNRWVYYNFLDPQRNLLSSDGVAVSQVQGAGYTTMDQDSLGDAVVAFHNSNNLFITIAIDAGCGLGLFTLNGGKYQYPGLNDFYWPYVTYTNSGLIEYSCSENSPAAGDPQNLAHSISTDQGVTWSDLHQFDIVYDISPMMTSSRVSNKVAIVYTQPIDDGSEPNQYNNNVVYIQSNDGSRWSYDKVNITNYQYEDTIRAYTDVDAVYDYNDNLHIVWNASGYYAVDGTITVDACFLFHWSQATGITMVNDSWYPSFPGAWNRSASKMSIAAAPPPYDNMLFVLWTHFDDADVSAGSWSNGELYFSTSTDGGATWSDPENLTNTNTNGCVDGDCDSDHWSSMAEQVVNDSVYILYIDDKDAGGIPQAEGYETENPVLYLAHHVDLTTSVDEQNELPSVFSVSQNYPNPFNAATNINFTLNANANVKLDVYNILGERVSTLLEGNMTAGDHTVNWDASNYPSGMYLYKLSANGHSETHRMVLLK